ncbi:hypothetical protein AYI70_g65 [Smittium culicis]|uniref:Uncharacterized protein n=1 Tax=Smittium culicis TaxID=133412 RepID=A0A1R1YIE1_9FUNG|nr:hypothetical protein AYI70_g65 [Smittium culicis]
MCPNSPQFPHFRTTSLRDLFGGGSENVPTSPSPTSYSQYPPPLYSSPLSPSLATMSSILNFITSTPFLFIFFPPLSSPNPFFLSISTPSPLSTTLPLLLSSTLLHKLLSLPPSNSMPLIPLRSALSPSFIIFFPVVGITNARKNMSFIDTLKKLNPLPIPVLSPSPHSCNIAFPCVALIKFLVVFQLANFSSFGLLFADCGIMSKFAIMSSLYLPTASPPPSLFPTPLSPPLSPPSTPAPPIPSTVPLTPPESINCNWLTNMLSNKHIYIKKKIPPSL